MMGSRSREDRKLWHLCFCRGCFEPIPRVLDANGDDPTILTRRDAHEATCVAYAGFVVSEKLARQARDDGRDDDA